MNFTCFSHIWQRFSCFWTPTSVMANLVISTKEMKIWNELFKNDLLKHQITNKLGKDFWNKIPEKWGFREARTALDTGFSQSTFASLRI